MRPSLALALAIIACVLVTGFHPDGLPFMPSAQFSDAAIAHYPAALHVYRHGFAPEWSELNMAGQPFSANPLNKTAYPPQLLAAWIAPPLSMNILFVLHLGLAAAGMWFWARALRFSEPAAAVAALAYTLSPRLIGHTAAGHLDLVYAMAWFPFLMAGLHAVMTSPSLRHIFWLALAAAMLVLADVRLSLFAIAAAAVYAVVLAAQHRTWRRLLILLGIGVWVGALTISVTLPLALWQPHLSRAALTSAEAGTFSLEPGMMVGMLLPPPATNIETQASVGVGVLLLAGISILYAPRRHLHWIVLMILAALYALGSNGFLWALLVEILPPLRWFRVPARAWFIVALIMPLLAGYGVQHLMDRTPSFGRHKALLLPLSIGLLAGICGVSALVSIPQLAQGGLRLLLVGSAMAATLFWIVRSKSLPRLAPALIFLIVLLDLGWNSRTWLEWRGHEDWITPYVPLAEALQRENADRIYSPAYSVPQQVAAEYDLHLFGGVDPFQLRGIAGAVESASGVGHHGYTVIQPPLISGEGEDLTTVNRGAVPDTAALAAWQVSHVVAPYPIEHPRLALNTLIDDLYLYRNLDYALTIPRGQVPRWANADDLPNPETVLTNIQWTTRAQWGASALLVMTLVAAFYISRRQRTLST